MRIQPKQRYIISLFILLMVSAIVIIDLSFLAEYDEPKLDAGIYPLIDPLPREAGVFARAEMADLYASMPKDTQHQRALTEYYKNRAYAGAPPVIPHPILNPLTMGGQACLQCHQNGGFVSQFRAYAPVTPHPELLNCNQCHVPVNTKSLFATSDFNGLRAEQNSQTAMWGSPPIIPHTLEMRENCLACHAGPAAPREIRVSHPERVNCRQCHASKTHITIEWQRKPAEKNE